MTELQFWKFKDQREKWALGLAVLALLAALSLGVLFLHVFGIPYLYHRPVTQNS